MISKSMDEWGLGPHIERFSSLVSSRMLSSMASVCCVRSSCMSKRRGGCMGGGRPMGRGGCMGGGCPMRRGSRPYSFTRSRQQPPMHIAWCSLLERQGEQVGSVYHTWMDGVVQQHTALSDQGNHLPYPIHTAWCSILERQGEQVGSVYHTFSASIILTPCPYDPTTVPSVPRSPGWHSLNARRFSSSSSSSAQSLLPPFCTFLPGQFSLLPSL